MYMQECSFIEWINSLVQVTGILPLRQKLQLLYDSPFTVPVIFSHYTNNCAPAIYSRTFGIGPIGPLEKHDYWSTGRNTLYPKPQ